MTVLPRGWQVYSGRDPEKALRGLRRRLRAVTRRWERRLMLGRVVRAALLALLGLSGLAGLFLLVASFFPWPPSVLLRHMAALPNCKAARLVDLAPAKTGEPGYWRWLDKDGNGWSCQH